MTRLQQFRVRRAKLLATQARLEAALDDVVPTLNLSPAATFEAIIAYGVDGLVAQGTVCRRDEALRVISRALTKRGLIG